MNREEKVYHHTHPITILYYSRWILLVGILPLLRGIGEFLRGEKVEINFSNWLDITIFIVIIIAAFLRWYLFTYSSDDESIVVRKGIFIRLYTELNWDKVAVIKEKRPLYLRAVKGSYLKIDSMGGNSREPDIDLCMSSKNAEELLKGWGDKVEVMEGTVLIPEKRSIFYLAFLSTNNFVGAFYIFTFISQAGRILGDEYSYFIVGSFENLARNTAARLSPIVMAISYFLLLAWGIGVVFTLMRYHSYEIVRMGDFLNSGGGILGKQKQSINLGKTSYVNMRQNIVSVFLKRYSLYITAPGISKERSDLTCILPNNKKKPLLESFRYILPEFVMTDNQISPAKRSSFRFLIGPGAGVLAIVLVFGFLIYKLDVWANFFVFVMIMLLIPTVLLGIIYYLEKDMSGVGISKGFLTVRYARFFVLNNVVISSRDIVQVKTRQSLFQKKAGNANIYIYTMSEGKARHRCRNVNLAEAEKLLHDYI